MKAKIITRVVFILSATLIIFIMLILFLSKTENNFFNSLIENKIIKLQSSQNSSVPFRKGERFLYKVKMGRLTVGSAELIFQGKDTLEERDVYIFSFETRLAKFYDKETVYAEINTFYPIRVERNLRMLGKSINIIENYNQTDKFVKIQSKGTDKSSVKVIQSDRKIQNIISLIYFYRNNELKINSTLDFNLPTKKIKMKVSNMEEIKVPKGEYKAYLLESMPKKYKVWLGTDKERTPLRIDGAIYFTGLKMVLDEIY